MGGLGIEMLLSCVQNVGMDPRICTKEEKIPSLMVSACAIFRTRGRRGRIFREGERSRYTLTYGARVHLHRT